MKNYDFISEIIATISTLTIGIIRGNSPDIQSEVYGTS